MRDQHVRPLCGYCTSSDTSTGHEGEATGPTPGIHFPSDFDDREDSKDGRVWLARCDECSMFRSDLDAARFVSAVTGWPIGVSYDKEDAIDSKDRARALAGEFRVFFAVTLADAQAFRLDGFILSIVKG